MPSYPIQCTSTGVGESTPPPAASTLTFTDTDGFVLCDPAPPLQFDLADLYGMEPSDRELRVALASGLSMRISGMGKLAAELTAKFSLARRERIAYVFRFGTPVGERWEEADVVPPEGGSPMRAGVRLFPSLLGILPDRGEPVALPFGDMRAVSFNDASYQVVVESADGAIWRIGKLGKRTSPFLEELKRSRLQLTTAYQTQLKNVMPHIAESELQKLSGEWREGVAVPARNLEARSAGAAARLFGFLPAEDRRPFVGALQSLFPEPALLGFYYSAELATESGRPPFEPFALFHKPGPQGTAVAWEVLSEMGTATYMFRGSEPDLAARINKALRAIQFAREPVYLPEAELQTTGQHRHYVPLLTRSPDLQFLRSRFAGRVPHVELKAYADQVATLCGRI